MDKKKVPIRDRISDDEKKYLVQRGEIKRNQQHCKTRNRILRALKGFLNSDGKLETFDVEGVVDGQVAQFTRLRNQLFAFTPKARYFRRNKAQNNILENVTLHMKSDSTILAGMEENEYLKHLGENSSILKVKELCNTPIDEEDENTFFVFGIKLHGSKSTVKIPIQDIYQIDIEPKVTEDRGIITSKAKEIMRNLKEVREKK